MALHLLGRAAQNPFTLRKTLTGFPGLHQVGEHVVDTRSLCKHQRLRDKKQQRQDRPRDKRHGADLYRKTGRGGDPHLDVDVLEQRPQHGHGRAGRQRRTLGLRRNQHKHKRLTRRLQQRLRLKPGPPSLPRRAAPVGRAEW